MKKRAVRVPTQRPPSSDLSVWTSESRNETVIRAHPVLDPGVTRQRPLRVPTYRSSLRSSREVTHWPLNSRTEFHRAPFHLERPPTKLPAYRLFPTLARQVIQSSGIPSRSSCQR